MTQEQKQLLFKYICAGLSYGLNIQVYYEEMSGSGYFDEKVWAVDNDEPFHVNDRWIENIKPYARPMSSMTEEEKKELKDICTIYNSDPSSSYEYFGIEIFHISRYGTNFESDYTAIDWLNKRHFDYYRLIEKGLALEAPEGMYNIK